jgi:transposase
MPDGEPEDHALGRSRGGFGTKIHLVTDVRGLPLGSVLSGGQAADCRMAPAALRSVRIKKRGPGRPRVRPKIVAGDKGYSYTTVRRHLTERGIKAVIPSRKDQRDGRRRLDKRRYKKRNAIERCVGWLKWNRRLGTRHEKLAVNYHAMTKLAMIRRCMHLLHPSDRT